MHFDAESDGADFINTSGGIFDIKRCDMGSLSLRTTLLERRYYAVNGMGVGAFCVEEVA